MIPTGDLDRDAYSAMTKADVVALDPFCDCEFGQSLRTNFRNQVQGWQDWIAETEAENATRAKRQTHRLFPGSGIPAKYDGLGMKTFERRVGSYGDDRKAAIAIARQLGDNHKIVKPSGVTKNSLLLWGEGSGVGKTGLATAVYRRLTETAGLSGLWVTHLDFYSAIKSEYGNHGDNVNVARIEAARSVDVLLFDNLTEVNKDDERNRLFEVFNWRHGHELITLFTTRLTPSEMERSLGPDLFERIGEMSVFVEVKGQSLREIG